MTAPLFPRQAPLLAHLHLPGNLLFSKLPFSSPATFTLTVSFSFLTYSPHWHLFSLTLLSSIFYFSLEGSLSLRVPGSHIQKEPDGISSLSFQRAHFPVGWNLGCKNIGCPKAYPGHPPQRRGQRKEDYEMEASGAEGPGLRRTGGLGAGRAAQGRGAVSRIPRPW